MFGLPTRHALKKMKRNLFPSVQKHWIIGRRGKEYLFFLSLFLKLNEITIFIQIINWFLIISKQLPLQTRLTPFSFLLLLFSEREYLTPHWIIRDDNSRHCYHPYITRRVERNYSSALLKDAPPSFFIFDFRISSFQGGISARDALWGKGRCRLCSKLA